MKKLIKCELGRSFPPAMPLQEWRDAGIEIYRNAELLTWQLADWAAYGEREFGALKEFCDSHGVNAGTMSTYAWVASKVEISRRREQLSFCHHMEVAALSARDQDKWLRKAQANRWSVSELRRQIRSSGKPSAAEGPKFAFEEKAALDLHHILTSKPKDYWTDHTRSLWKEKLRPIIEFYVACIDYKNIRIAAGAARENGSSPIGI